MGNVRRVITWRRYRKFLRLITEGLPARRAADLAGVPENALGEPRVARLVRIAEARFQHSRLSAIYAASRVRVTRAKDAVGRDRAGQIWERSDWKSSAWLLERRHPGEWGPTQAPVVASTVIEILSALNALRNRPAVSLADLRHRPQLPPRADGGEPAAESE